jgi:DNA polymerase-3 subunit gamma/tau
MAFAGQSVSAEDVATVLGLVGRDLVFDIVTAVADEVPSAAFDLAGRAVELGYDLRLVCRELSRVVRDMLVLSVDPSRIEDPEIAAETERDRLKALTARFSREDLLRAFDLLARAEFEIRGAVQPRYNLEMALLRWIHMRKLVPLTELLGGVGKLSAPQGATPPAPAVRRAGPSSAPELVVVDGRRGAGPAESPSRPASNAASAPEPRDERGAFLSEIKRAKGAFYNTVVAQAQKIEFGPAKIVFAFLPTHRLLREQLEQNRSWLESVAATVTGRKMAVTALQQGGPEADAVQAPTAGRAAIDLKAAALNDTAVQAMLDVFPAEIEDVEEI